MQRNIAKGFFNYDALLVKNGRVVSLEQQKRAIAFYQIGLKCPLSIVSYPLLLSTDVLTTNHCPNVLRTAWMRSRNVNRDFAAKVGDGGGWFG